MTPTQAQIDAAQLAKWIGELKWKSVEKDNMEYEVRMTCYVRDALLRWAALTAAAEVDPDGSKFITARNAAMWDAATIERCAQVADEYGGWGPHIAAAIRALATEKS